MAGHDLVIRQGTVVDGTGSSPRAADVAVDGGRITAVGEITGRGRGVAEGAAGSWTASKLAIAWGSPSSESAKSAAVRSGIGAPFLSVTTRSTVTSSIWEGKVGVAAAGEGEGAGAGGMAWAPARQGTTRKAERLSMGFQFIGSSWPSPDGRGRAVGMGPGDFCHSGREKSTRRPA